MTVTTRPWLVRLTNILLNYRGWWLCFAIATTLAAAVPASRLQFDQSIESLYAKDNARLAAWRDSKRLFGGDEFVVVAYTDPELFEPGGDKLNPAAAERIEALAEKLRTVPGLQADSFQHLAHALQAPFGRSIIRKLMEGILVGTDEKTTSIFCRLEPPGTASIPRSETYRRVREIADANTPPAAVVGEPVQVHDMFRYVEEDGATLGLASSALLMTVIFALFRSLRWMILPLLVVQVTLFWTKGLLVVSGMQLSMVSSMLNSLVTIIGIATVMHITLKYRENRASAEPVEALRKTMLDLTVPIFWTIATTAAGFAALLTSHIAPVASFGIMMTLATLLVMVACAIVLPGSILIGESQRIPGKAPAEDRVSRALGHLTVWVEHRPLLVGAGMAALTAFCGAGLFYLKVETDFSKNFRANSPIVRSLDLFETRLGGAGTWEVNFPAPNELDPDFLSEVRELAAELRDLEDQNSPGRLTKVVSITDGLDVLTFLPLSWRISALERMQPDFITSLYNAQDGRMRIMLRARERQPSETKLKLIDDVEATARRHFPEARATGLFVLLTYLIESLMDDQLGSFLIAAAAIVILMTMAYHSFAFGSILLIPNLFPIVLVIGTMGWIGLPVNLATAMIASVSMGLTVDSSIHYLAGYTDARRRGLSYSAALKSTHQGVGLALVFANVALVVGFSVLTLSHFIPLVYFGILVSVAMLGGLMGNLILLPLLLRIVDRR
ncbi:efflux RND transporter permease subunit [Schlesneria paludicola]|uniref:efflux RND transporter permease subunit n=1 Tax=Schlesneria paludicola TaxID=360056 RepID=UPI00029B3C4E|nr:MMPL family transporter [Schlesneria paludicola]